MVTLHKLNFYRLLKINKYFKQISQGRCVSYIQGQEPEPKVREYFYFIDHQGMLFLDDSRMKNFTSCFKDKKFLKFFFDRLKINTSKRYAPDFPYISLCGRERNFIRCDDYPYVYTHVIQKTIDGTTKNLFCYAHATDLLCAPFQPDKIYMSPESGRVYHPAPDKVGAIGLVRSNLAIEFSKSFTFENGELKPPTHFMWNNETYLLDTNWYKEAVIKNRERNIFVRDDIIKEELEG